jgi:AcrR family transcriptional regulator
LTLAGGCFINVVMSSSTTMIPHDPQPIGGSPSGSGGTVGRNFDARQRADTRERIFETALREFREVGFGAAQVDRIAKAAGVARGTFYFHFPTKDDVLLELARRINARVVRRVGALGGAKTSLQELLVRVNDAIMDEHGRVGEAGLLREMLSLYVRRPYDVQDPSHNLPTLSDQLTFHLRAAAERGELRSSLSPEQVAIVLMTSLFGIYSRLPQGAELRGACESLIDLVVKGLLAPA